MNNTRERILRSALALFARDGYEAVSVSTIAGELNMTKGALYRHFKNKRDIFDSIVSRMVEMDAARAHESGVPEADYAQNPGEYRLVEAAHIREFTLEQYRFWTQDAFAVNFRRMLSLEQYRNQEMLDLYQRTIVSGPLEYMEEIFREMMAAGRLRAGDAKALALEFFAPLFLLIQISDGGQTGGEELLCAHMDKFFKDNLKGSDSI